MERQKIKQAAKDGVVMILRVAAVLAAIAADGTFWAYEHAQTRFAAPQPPKRVKIPVRQLGLKSGLHVTVRRPGPVRKINVRYIESE